MDYPSGPLQFLDLAGPSVTAAYAGAAGAVGCALGWLLTRSRTRGAPPASIAALPTAMYVVGVDGIILDASDAFLRLVGQARESVEGRPARALVRPEDASKLEASGEADFTLASGQRLTVKITRGGVGSKTVVWEDLTESSEKLKELQANNEQLVEFNRGLQDTMLWAREMAAHAEMVSAARTQFLANVSHEIRTPMNSILGMTDLALDTQLTEQQRDYLDMVRASGQSLLILLNDVLDFSKIEAGKLSLHPRRFDIRALIEEALKPMVLRAASRSLEFYSTIHPDVPAKVVGDDERLRQLLLNLTGNAIKFTSSGSIQVAIEPVPSHPDAVRILISDTGIGIPPDKQEAIFEPFTQADGSMTRRYGGTGLGLSISAKLVEMMGGRLYVSSRPGEGTTFATIIHLPRAEGGPTAVDVTARKAPRWQGRLRVLVAEDSVTNQILVRRLLEREGHAVDVAQTGEEAVRKFRESKYDLVLMDVQMPEMDGLEATGGIREIEKQEGGHVPILAMTAHAMPGDREQCLAAGMDGYLSKPVQSPELLRAVYEATALRVYAGADRLPDPGPVDHEAALERVGGDVELLQEVAQLFLDEYPGMLAAIGKALQGKSPQELEHAAHSLKGSVSNFGARSVVRAALALEMLGRAGSTEGGDELFEMLEHELKELKPALEALAAGDPSGLAEAGPG
ncbi:MAG: ATP-binding protein [Bryobacteraceae bacterium]